MDITHLSRPIRAVVDDLPTCGVSMLAKGFRPDEDMDGIREMLGIGNAEEAWRRAARLRQAVVSRIPAARLDAFVRACVDPFVLSFDTRRLDTGFDLYPNDGQDDLEILYRVEILEGRALWALSRVDEVRLCLTRALAMSPRDGQGVRYRLAGALLRGGSPSRAAALVSLYDPSGSPVQRDRIVGWAGLVSNMLTSGSGPRRARDEFLLGERMDADPAVVAAVLRPDMSRVRPGDDEPAIRVAEWIREAVRADAGLAALFARHAGAPVLA